MNSPGVSIKVIKDICIVGGILTIFSIAGFLMLPAVLKSAIPQIIEQATGRKASINKVQFNPFSLQFSLQGFSLPELNGKPFASFDNFYIDLDLWRSIAESALVFDQVLLSKPVVRIAKQKDGQFNFNDLIKSKTETKKEDDKVFPVIIDKVSLSEGKLAWEDAHVDEPVNEEIYPINLGIDYLSTQTAKQFPIRLSIALKSGGTLDWQGVAGIRTVSSSGRIKLDNINLKTIRGLALQNKPSFDLQGSGLLELEYNAAYAGKTFNLGINRSRFRIQGFQFSEQGRNNLTVKIQETVLVGEYKFNYVDNKWQFKADKSKLDVNKIELPGLGNSRALIEIAKVGLETRYQADNADNRINFILSGDKFDLNDVNLTELAQNKPIVNIPNFNVRGIGFNLANREFSAEAVKADNADFKLWLDTEGKINYQDLLPVAKAMENTSEKTVDPPLQAEPAWRISVQNISLDNFGLFFEDRTLKQPVVFNAKPIDLKLGSFTNKVGASLPIQFNAGINETGSIKLDGDTVIEPFSSRLAIKVNDIDLERFQPYIDKYARLDIIDGRLNVDGKLAIALSAKDKPDVTFKGNTGVAGLLTRDQILNKDFVKWKQLTLNDIDADIKANRYTAKLLLIEKPFARVIIAKDKSVNVNDIFMTAKSKPVRSSSTKKIDKIDKDKPYFKLDKIQVVDGSSDFADLSLILPFAAQIKSLDGGASGISSEQKSTVKVSLKGNAYDLAPVDIKGDISPYLGDYNVEMSFQGMPMPLVSPYMVQFAGYKVEKGKLTLGLKYQVSKGQLTASNNILIDQFELGEKVESPSAVSVPLELAVALLKDSSGKIKMDVPITGSLEDPKFSVGKIITEALLNVITKIVTSPFNAIASLIGSEENLDAISFAPGKAELDKKQIKKLEGLSKALKDRPILNIEIKGAAFKEQDWPAMKETALFDQLKSMKAAEANNKGGKKILAEYVELSDEEYKRLLAQMFIEKFPLLTERSLFGKPRLVQPESGDFYAIAKQKLAEIIKPDPHRLKDLAAERAQVIAKYIVQQGGIPNDRVFILDPAIDSDRDTKKIVASLSLKTN